MATGARGGRAGMPLETVDARQLPRPGLPLFRCRNGKTAGVTDEGFPSRVWARPSRPKMSAISAAGTGTPMILCARATRMRTGLRSGSFATVSTVRPASPPQTSRMSRVARSIASDVVVEVHAALEAVRGVAREVVAPRASATASG